MKVYLLLKNIKIQNANALSSTISIGFPAMTAWLGGVHALQRKINERKEFSDIKMPKVAVCCHEYKLEVYGDAKAKNVLIGTSNPLKKNGDRPSTIEEPRIQLNVSLLIEVSGVSVKNEKAFVDFVEDILPMMKLASGDILKVGTCELCYDSEADQNEERSILNKLMPGYILIERRDLIKNSEEPSGIERLLSYLKTYLSETTEDEMLVERKTAGWLVPIGVGFRGISHLTNVKDQRDSSKLHQFVEPIVTLGEFKMPYQIEHIKDILWEYQYISDKSLYLCKNQCD